MAILRYILHITDLHHFMHPCSLNLTLDTHPTTANLVIMKRSTLRSWQSEVNTLLRLLICSLVLLQSSRKINAFLLSNPRVVSTLRSRVTQQPQPHCGEYAGLRSSHGGCRAVLAPLKMTSENEPAAVVGSASERAAKLRAVAAGLRAEVCIHSCTQVQ